MKATDLRFALPAAAMAAVAILCAGFSADRADSRVRTAFAKGSVQAKIEFCTDCHGPSGQGYLGFLPIPRLAGQPALYIEHQLQAFVERRRERDIFFNMAKTHSVGPGIRAAVVEHFRHLNPKPFGRGPRHLAATGKRLYEEGLPEANIPACSACHGPDAKGQDAIPRLAGQLYAYTVKELVHWDSERNQYRAKNETSVVMEPIAHSLTRQQIEAIAAYLSHLE